MANRIYVVSDGQLQPLSEQPSRDEAQLQALLSSSPEVLEATEFGGGVEHHWLLVQPELGIPSDPDAGERWRADHLLLDQDGVPTVVEVKRSTDTRVRREVVGQMLDYAAALSTEDTCRSGGSEPEAALRAFLGQANDAADEPTADDFWRRVQANLDADRVRMLFVADRIPFQLRRIIEFMNKQMSPAEVYGVEVRQYGGNGLEAVVPVVVGETTKRRAGASAPGSAPENVDQLLQRIRDNAGEEAGHVAEALISWARGQGYEVHPRKLAGGAITVRAPVPGKPTPFVCFHLLKSGQIRVPLRLARKQPPFDNPQETQAWLDALNEIDGVDIPEGYAHSGAPNIPLSAVAAEPAFSHFIETAKWTIRRATEARGES